MINYKETYHIKMHKKTLSDIQIIIRINYCINEMFKHLFDKSIKRRARKCRKHFNSGRVSLITHLY